MRVTERGTRLVVQETPGCIWIFGSWFVAGGALAMAMPFIAVNRADIAAWGRLVSIGFGAGVAAAGLFTIHAAPAIRTEIDRATGSVRVRSRGPGRRTRVDDFTIRDIGVVQVLPARDSDGDEYYTLRLLLRDGRELALHAQPSYGKDAIERSAQQIRNYVGMRTHS